MVSRSRAVPVSHLPANVGGPDEETADGTAKPATNTAPPVVAERSAGTAVLVDSLTPNRAGLWGAAVQSNVRSVASKPGASPAAILERTIRSKPAYQALTKGDKAIAEWIMWKARMADPDKQLRYLNKLQLLFDTPFTARPGSSGVGELADMTNAGVEASLAKERARGDVFKGQEELRTAGAVLSTH